MKPMGKQLPIKSSTGREFWIMEIESVKNKGIIVFFADQKDDEEYGFFHVIDHDELETLSFQDRESFIDVTDRNYEHTTKEVLIPYDAWLQDISGEDLIELLQDEIQSALESAIKNKQL